MRGAQLSHTWYIEAFRYTEQFAEQESPQSPLVIGWSVSVLFGGE